MVAKQKQNRIEKTLIAQDGTQSCAHLGLVDRDGAFFYVIDAGTKHFDFHPLTEVISKAEAEKRSLEDELSLAYAAYDDVERRADNLSDLCAEMLECGKFPKDKKTFFKGKLYRNKSEVS